MELSMEKRKTSRLPSLLQSLVSLGMVERLPHDEYPDGEHKPGWTIRREAGGHELVMECDPETMLIWIWVDGHRHLIPYWDNDLRYNFGRALAMFLQDSSEITTAASTEQMPAVLNETEKGDRWDAMG